uniref:Uncharacterized protein n=1 Tax=Haemonchus contortus TaxID=6289 RepID=W6NPB1_HAECO
MRHKLDHLEQLITESKESVMNALKSRSICLNHDHPQCHRSDNQETQGNRYENDIIEGNAGFMGGVEEPDEDIATEDAELAQKEIAQEEEQHEDEVVEAEGAELAEEEGAEEEEEHHENEVVVVVEGNEQAEERIAEAEIEEFDEEDNGEPENEEAEEDILMREIDQEDDPNGLPEGEQEEQMALIIEQKFRSTQQALHNFEEILRQLKEE